MSTTLSVTEAQAQLPELVARAARDAEQKELRRLSHRHEQLMVKRASAMLAEE